VVVATNVTMTVVVLLMVDDVMRVATALEEGVAATTATLRTGVTVVSTAMITEAGESIAMLHLDARTATSAAETTDVEVEVVGDIKTGMIDVVATTAAVVASMLLLPETLASHTLLAVLVVVVLVVAVAVALTTMLQQETDMAVIGEFRFGVLDRHQRAMPFDNGFKASLLPLTQLIRLLYYEWFPSSAWAISAGRCIGSTLFSCFITKVSISLLGVSSAESAFAALAIDFLGP
jgi:hypothetical protein